MTVLKVDWTGHLYAVFPPHAPGRIVIFTDQAPGNGVMICHWFRDSGDRDLQQIMDESGRDLVPKKMHVPGPEQKTSFLVYGLEIEEGPPYPLNNRQPGGVATWEDYSEQKT